MTLKIYGQNIKVQWGDTKTQVSSNLTRIMCKDEQNVNILTNMHSTQAEGNFCDEHEKAQKLATVRDIIHTWGVWTNLPHDKLRPYQQTDLGMD